MSVFIHQDLSGVSALAACDPAVQSLQMDHGALRNKEQHQSRGGRRGAHDRYTSRENNVKKKINCDPKSFNRITIFLR